jgi:DNA-binding LytR/AlgR family response regulator
VFSGKNQVLEFVLLGLLGGVYFSCSQLLLPKLLKFSVYKVWQFILWTLAEVALLTLLLTVLYDDVKNAWNFVAEYSTNFKYVSLTLLLPYSFSLVILSLYQNKQAIEKFNNATHDNNSDNALVQFPDENGNIRLSIQLSDILYLVSIDNYVEIYYQIDGGEVRKELLRNSLKKLEEYLCHLPIKRCHRSYMVNLENISLIKKMAKKRVAIIKGRNQIIPISKTYLEQFIV